MRIAGLALLMAGCATPSGPVHGVASVVLSAPGAEGRVAAPGGVRSSTGRPRAPGAGLALDVLAPGWILAFRSETQSLPADLESPAARRTSLQTWELAAGPCLADGRGLRLDAFAGGRARVLRVADSLGRLPSSDAERETWIEPFAGLRADLRLRRALSLRLRGDSALGNSEGRGAWRASAAGVFDLSPTSALSIGWEESSIHRDRGHGGDRFLYDVTSSGPFLALELRF